MPKKQLIDKSYMDQAKAAASLSKDPYIKAGCVILSSDGRKLATGRNGFAAGMKETDDLWSKETKQEYVIHAELNALLNCPFDIEGSTLYCTYQPCHRCLQYILNSGVRSVVFEVPKPHTEYPEIWLEAAKLFDSIYQIDKEGKPLEGILIGNKKHYFKTY